MMSFRCLSIRSFDPACVRAAVRRLPEQGVAHPAKPERSPTSVSELTVVKRVDQPDDVGEIALPLPDLCLVVLIGAAGCLCRSTR